MDTKRFLQRHIIYNTFPFDIFKGNYACDTEKSVRIHSHDYFEIEIVLGGSAMHAVAGNYYTLRAGEAFVLSGELSHAIREAHDFTFYNISFDMALLSPHLHELENLPGFQALFLIGSDDHAGWQSRLHLSGADLQRAEQLCLSMNKEYSASAKGFRCAISADLLSLVLLLSRCYEHSADMFTTATDQIAYIFAYIQRHYTDMLTLDMLAEKVKMSKRTFCRQFKAIHEVAPMDYILALRISRAENLLLLDDYSITDIAYECGFSDSGYFSQCFKRRTGLTPRAYRQERS